MSTEKNVGSLLVVGLFTLLVCTSIGIFVYFSSISHEANNPPSADFDWAPHSPSQGENITFDASQSSDSDGSITSYEWDFGDGTTGSGRTVTHTYQVAQPYTVTLIVTDDDGATDGENHKIAFAAPS